MLSMVSWVVCNSMLFRTTCCMAFTRLHGTVSQKTETLHSHHCENLRCNSMELLHHILFYYCNHHITSSCLSQISVWMNLWSISFMLWSCSIIFIRVKFHNLKTPITIRHIILTNSVAVILAELLYFRIILCVWNVFILFRMYGHTTRLSFLTTCFSSLSHHQEFDFLTCLHSSAAGTWKAIGHSFSSDNSGKIFVLPPFLSVSQFPPLAFTSLSSCRNCMWYLCPAWVYMQ